MRNTRLWTDKRLALIVLIVALLSVAGVLLVPAAASAQAAKQNPLGGARGVVKNSDGNPLEGIMVQLISKKNSIRTTVYTDGAGRYEFPKLESGDYVLRIPRPLEYARYQKDLRLEGSPELEPITLTRKHGGEYLPPNPDILPQLTEAEWLFNLPGTAQEKDALMSTCGGSCHGFQNQFRARFSEKDWRTIINRMSNYSERILVRPSNVEVTYNPVTKQMDYKKTREAGSEVEHTGATSEGKEIVTKWLTRIRGVDAEDPPMKPFPRPQGRATRVIVTEYELPRLGEIIHDVTGDAQGNIWYTSNRSPFLGKLDPKTGKVTSYRVPTFEKMHPGLHWVKVDKEGMVWISDTWARSIGRFNPKTEKFDYVYTGTHGNVALAPDGTIYQARGGKIFKFDSRQKDFWQSGKPVKTYPLSKIPRAYGNFVSDDGKFFAGGGTGVIWMDLQKEEVREVPAPSGDAGSGRGNFDPFGNAWMGGKAGALVKYDPKANAVSEYYPPTPHVNFYAATADKNGEVWAGEMHGGRIARFNPKTVQWTEYQLPSVWSFDYTGWVDNSTNPVSYWYGDYYGYIVHVQPLD